MTTFAPLRTLFRAMLSLGFLATAVAQTATPLPAPAAATPSSRPADFSAEPFVIQHLSTVFAMNADGTGTRTQSVIVTVQSEAALRQLSVITVPFASASEHVTFTYARARHRTGSVTDTPLTDVQEQPEPVTLQAPFYSDLKQLQLPVKNLGVGDTLEWQAVVTRTKSEAPGQFWGSQSFVTEGVTLAEDCELSFPSSLHPTIWTNPKSKASPTHTTGGDRTVYRWSAHTLNPTVGAVAEAEKARKAKLVLTPDDELDATEGKLPDVAWTTFPDWAAVGAWYRGLEDGRTAPDPAMEAKVAELTAGKTSQEEKVRAVYAYVSTQIRYIGVALGVGRYQPHAASAVLDNQYGDCKDKHTLLAAMLHALGLQPDAVLIGAGIRFNEAVPSPASFNHLITRVALGGKEVWLDSTAEVAPYRALLAVIRDKQALVVADTGTAFIARTPATLPFAPYATTVVTGTLDKDLASTSTFTLSFQNDDAIGLRAVLRTISPAQYPEFVQRLMQGLNFGGNTSNAMISRVDDISQPLTISFTYKRDHEADWGDNRITVPFMQLSLPAVDEKNPPIASIQLGTPRTDTSSLELKLPTGWSAELPEAVHATSPFATCDVTYHLESGVLKAERRLVILKDKIPAADAGRYKTWYDAAGVSGVPYVQLLPASHTPSAGTPRSANSAAEALLKQATQAFQRNDLAGAENLLNTAKALNDTQPYLWSRYGYLRYLQGDPEAGIRDDRKELALHPSEYDVYGFILFIQQHREQRAEALETMQQWERADPANPMPVIDQINLLTEDGQFAEAAKAGAAGLAHLPEDVRGDERLQLLLATARLKSTDKTAGAASLLSLLHATTDDGIRNDAAYALADANVDLPDAEAAEREVLNALTTKTQTWTLDENPQTLLGTSALLTASWDTLGWIYFHEGKLADAESLIGAAWRNRADAIVGDHLGQIQAARGDRHAALQSYKLALAALPLVNSLGVRTSPSPLALALRIKISAGGGSPKDADSGANAALQKLRTFDLGAAEAGTANSTAEYRLLLAGGKVVRAEPVKSNGPTVVHGESLLKRAELKDLFPPGSAAQLVRIGFLNCHGGKCELVLQP